MSGRLIPLLACVLLVLAGCAPRTGSDRMSGRLPNLLPPEVSLTVGQATIDSFNPPGTGSRVQLRVPITVSNPNTFALHLRHLDHSLSLAGQAPMPGGTAITDTVSLLPGASRQLELSIERSLTGNPALIQAVADAFTGAALPIAVDLEVGFTSANHAWLTSRNYSLNGTAHATGSLQAPQLGLVAGESSAYSLQVDHPVVSVMLEVLNPGNVGYLVHARNLVLNLGGLPVAQVDLPPSPVSAFGSARLALVFTPDPGLLSPAARTALSDALAGTSTQLSVTGDLAYDVLGLGSFPLPAGERLTTDLGVD